MKQNKKVKDSERYIFKPYNNRTSSVYRNSSLKHPHEQRNSIAQKQFQSLNLQNYAQNMHRNRKKSLPPVSKSISYHKYFQRQPSLSLQKLLAKKSKLQYDDQLARSRKTKTQQLENSRLSQSSLTSAVNEVYKIKPTDKYFSKLKDLRFVERLLLMEPTKDVKRSQQKKFYDVQQEYKNRISKLGIKETIKQKRIMNRQKRQWI